MTLKIRALIFNCKENKVISKVVGKWRIKRENFFGPFSAKVALQTPSTAFSSSKVTPQTPTFMAHHGWFYEPHFFGFHKK